METNIHGVFAVGDVRDKFLKQVATAVGDGAIAGYAAEKYIAESEIYESQILNEGKESIVYLYNAADCASREMLPMIEEFERAYSDKVCITKVDTYKSDGIARKLGISKCPCVVYLNQNEIVKTMDDEITFKNLEEIFS
jgi:thioredoxin reductase (NADPH)